MATPSEPTVAKSGYAMADVAGADERLRLEQLERLNDVETVRRIDHIGVAKGWRCVEVGAGAGSIAEALAGRVGEQGLVAAVDQDPRFLRDFVGPGRSVVTHDIMAGPVAPGGFDFAHCRAVLAHVEDIDIAVGHLIQSVRPGGWVLCEEPDYGPMEPCDPDRPHAADLATFRFIMTDGGSVDGYAGRRTFASLRNAGLRAIRNEAHGAIGVGGGIRAQFRVKSLENSRPVILAAAPGSEEVIDRMIQMFKDPTFTYIDNNWIASWGQTPG